MTVMQTPEKYCYFVVYKQFICSRKVSQCIRKCTEFRRISAAKLINFFLQKCGAYLRAVLNTVVIPLSAVFTRISAAALINPPQMQRLFEAALVRVITVIGSLRVYYI